MKCSLILICSTIGDTRVVFPNRQNTHDLVATVTEKSQIHVFLVRFPVSYLLVHCHQVSNIRGTSVSNKIVDHSDVVGASPGGAAPTTSSFST